MRPYRRGLRERPWAGYLLWFVALNGIYHSNLRPIAAGDSLPASLIPFSVWLDHAVTLNRFGPWIREHVPYGANVLRESGGSWYSVYPVAGPVLIAPLYTPLALAPSLAGRSPEVLIGLARIAEKFAAAAITALAAVWMLALLRRLTAERWAWALAWTFALGSATWSAASQALWQHTFGIVAIVACLYCLDRWGPGVGCGAAMGIALMIRPTNVILLPAIAAALWVRRDGFPAWWRTFAPAAAGAGIVAAYNWRVFHTLAGGYPAGLDGNFFGGLAGILASPGRGLLWYTPVALFAAASLLPAARAARQAHRPVFVASAVFAGLHLAVIAKWPVWWGGYCWGPRLLTEMLPCLMVLIAIGVPAISGRSWRLAFAAVAVYGGLIQVVGVYCYPKGHWDHLPVSVDARPSRLWDWPDNPIVRTVRAGPAWEPYQVVGAGLRGGLPAAAAKLREVGVNGY